MKRGHIIGACGLILALIGLIVFLLAGRDDINATKGQHVGTSTDPAVLDPDLLNKLLGGGDDSSSSSSIVADFSVPPLAQPNSTITTPPTTTTKATSPMELAPTGIAKLDTAIATGQQQAQTLSDTVNDALQSKVAGIMGQIQATKQATMSFVAVEGCTPKDADDLRFMVDHTSCSVVTLMPNTNYSIVEHLVIRRRITIIGRPLGMPYIDAQNSTRAFLVEAGGFLDVRFVHVVKGKIIEIVRLLLYQVRGSVCWTRRGGVAMFTGCVFTISFRNAMQIVGLTPPITNIQVIGGGFLAESGTIRMTDCQFASARIGIAFRELQFFGGEFLILGGNVYLTGCIFINMAIFSNAFGAGGYIANLGGSVVVTGCLFNYIAPFVCTSGVGYLFFFGGGTMIVTGSIVTTSLGFVAYFGGGMGVFTGSGVSVLTGFMHVANSAIGIGAGLGFQTAVGAGISIRTGVLQSSMSAIGSVAGVGVSNYVGAGVAVFTDISLSRSTAILSFYGCGSYFYLGAGVATIVNTLGIFNTGIGFTVYAGGDTAILAGYLTRVNQLYISTFAISFTAGQGSDLFLGLGGATLVYNVYVVPETPIRFRNPGLVAIYVAGNNVILANAIGNARNIYGLVTVNKHGQTDWQKNIFVAKKISWRFSNAGPRGDDFIARRNLGGADENPRRGFSFLEAEANAAGAEGTAEGTPVDYSETPDYFHARNLNVVTITDMKPAMKALFDKYMPVDETSPKEEERVLSSGSLGAALLEGLGEIADAKKTLADTTAALEAAPETSPDDWRPEFVKPSNVSHADDPLYVFAEMPGLKVNESKTDRIYVAKPLDACGLCDITPGMTMDNVDGPGATSCAMENACEKLDSSAVDMAATLEGKGTGEGTTQKPVSGMWMTGREESAANTTVQQLELRAIFTPSSAGGSPEKKQVKHALITAIGELGLSDRWHLHVEASMEATKNVDPLLRYEVSTEDYEDEVDFGHVDPGEVEGQQECGRNELFKAYIVSDWKNVTDEISRKIKTKTGTKALTLALQAAVDSSVVAARVDAPKGTIPPTAPSICELVTYRTTSILIPASSMVGVVDAAPVSRRTTASSTEFHRVLSADGTRWEREEAEVEEDDDQIKALLLKEANAALTIYVSADVNPQDLLRQLPTRVEEVDIGGIYSLIVSNFPPAVRAVTLTVHAVPESGEDVFVGSFASKPHLITRQQVWEWIPSEVEGLERGREYYLEVTSSDGSSFDATNKFEVR
ncbi:hypothetical protein VYU27_006247 [Nannochloropsis oceanica]